jgi:hypothetical protein
MLNILITIDKNNAVKYICPINIQLWEFQTERKGKKKSSKN